MWQNSAAGVQKTSDTTERKNESYANLNVDTGEFARNVHFKDTGGLTYNEYFRRLVDAGQNLYKRAESRCNHLQ